MGVVIYITDRLKNMSLNSNILNNKEMYIFKIYRFFSVFRKKKRNGVIKIKLRQKLIKLFLTLRSSLNGFLTVEHFAVWIIDFKETVNEIRIM